MSFTILLPLLLLAVGCAAPRPPHWKPLTAEELSRPLTLEDSVGLALASDLHATTWRARVAAARADLTTARAIPNPVFTATWEDVGIRDAENKSISTSAYGLNYPIFFWVTRPFEVAAARWKLAAEQHGVRDERRQLAIEIGTSYFGLLAAGHKEKASEDLLHEAREALRLAEESFKLGAVSGHDVALARTEVRQAESELFDARREARAQALTFSFALGADRPIAARVQETTLTLPLDLDRVTTISATLPEALLARAAERDPALARARAEREAAEQELKLEQLKIIPLHDAVGTAERKNAAEGMGATYAFEVPIPLFDWNKGGIGKARAALLAAQTEEEKARRELASRLSEAWESYNTARTRYETYALRLTADREKLALDAQDLFASGQMSYTDLLQARREWRQTELTAVDSWRERMASAWKIQCEIGNQGAQPVPKKRK